MLNSFTEQQPSPFIKHCQYDQSYGTIYDSVYDPGFIFYESDEHSEVENPGFDLNDMPASPSGLFKRQH